MNISSSYRLTVRENGVVLVSRGAVTATGNGQKGQDGNILIQGSQVSAGNDALLSASRDVSLISAENTSKLDGKNKSKDGSVGVGVGAGSGGWGINVSASINAGKGSEKGNGTTHTETTLDAGNNLTLISGRDANLIGAQVSGESVTADIGRDLTIRSEQDTDSYHSKQQNISAGGSFNIGSMSGSASINASRDKMDSNYQSVNEQSGITAGSGGFDIKAGGHTRLDGAVIASSATEDKNRLETGTLGWSDIHNEAEYKVEHQSVGMSTGGSTGGQFAGNMANSMLSGGNSSGSAEGTTSSAISGGNIIIRDKDSQQQNVDDLSRDTANASGSIGQIFDREKERQKIQESQLISEIGTQVSDIARTEGAVSATKAAQEKMKNITDDDRSAAIAALEKQGKTGITEEDIASQIYQTAYNNAMNESSNGTGGRTQQAIQAVTAAVQGVAGGDINAAIAGAAAPYLAEVIGHQSGLEGMSKVAAHAVANAVLASMQGQNALAGAAGAATGELAGMIALEIYGKPVSELSESEKQTISSLATIASGIAGGLTGNSTSSALAGAQAGKTTVENNSLSSTQALTFDKELSDCRKSGGDCQAVIDKWKQVSDKQSAETDQKLKDNPLEAVVVDKEVAQGGSDMANRPGWLGNIGADVMTSDEAKAYVQQWNGQDLANIDVNSPTWTKFAVFASDPENQAMLVSGGLLAKDLVQLAKATVTNLSQGGIPFAIKSMQVGLRNPQQVDQLKNDMVSGNYKFTAPEGRIAGYVDSKGNYYISKGNHRMVAAQEIYKKTGDASYIEKLIQNGSWTQTKNAPAGASSIPTRK